MGYAGIFLFIQEAIIFLVSTKYYKSWSDVETLEALHQPQEVIWLALRSASGAGSSSFLPIFETRMSRGILVS